MQTTTHIISQKPPPVLREGLLYKQRNHFKGWRSRWFVLDNQFLHYYLEKEDMASRNSIQIDAGTIVVTETNVKMSNDVPYYPFLISHPKSSMVYRLSSPSKEDRDGWVSALNGLIHRDDPESKEDKDHSLRSSYVYSPTSGDAESVSESVSETSPTQGTIDSEEGVKEGGEVDSDDASADIDNAATTLTNIPPECHDLIEKTVQKLLDAASSDDPSRWTLMFNKKGVAGYSQVASSSSGASAICVKGVCKLPFTLPEIYDIVANGNRRVELDSQLAEYKRLKWFSRHTGIEHLQFKAVWPTTARDFCNLTHWRLLKNGWMVTMGVSKDFPDICPEQSGFVRAKLLGGGYVFKPVPGGTLATIVVQSDLGGTLPASICNLAAQSQPYVLMTLRRLLEKSQNRDPLPLDSLPPRVCYEDMLNCAMKYQFGKIESENEEESRTSGSSLSLASTQRLTQRDFVDSREHVQLHSEKSNADQSGKDLEPLYPDLTRAQIPSYCSAKLETLIQRILKDALQTRDVDWEHLSSKKGIEAYAKVPGPSGPAFYIKGETFLPYTIPEIFSAYCNPKNRPVLDSQMATYTRPRCLSRHVAYEYMQFKGQWPTTARDSCNITHWRLLNNGTLVDIGFSDNLQPENKDFVRAELQLGGYVLIPTKGGTTAVIVVDTKLGGSLPNSICQMASAHQPATLHKLRTLLDKMYPNSSPSRPGLDIPESPEKVYDKLVNISQKYQGNIDDSSNQSITESELKNSKNIPQSTNEIPSPARPRRKKRIDFLGFVLLILPIVDIFCEIFVANSVFCARLSYYSWAITLYVYLVYYENLISWLLQKHLGTMCKGSSARAGAEVYRFNVDMGRMEDCLSELESENRTETTLTPAHITVKAVATALDEMRHMHGVLLGDKLFRAPSSPVDISFTESSAAGDDDGRFLHSVHDVSSSAADVCTIAHEAAQYKEHHQANMSTMRLISRLLRPVIPTFIIQLVLMCNTGALMALLLTLGVDVCPFGAGMVISVLPRDENKDGVRAGVNSGTPVGRPSGEMDVNEVDFSVLPLSSNVTSSRFGLCMPSVTVTLGHGGVKFVPIHHHEKKIVRKFRVLNVSVCLHEVLTSSPGCSLQERQDFITRLKSLLNNPKQVLN